MKNKMHRIKIIIILFTFLQLPNFARENNFDLSNPSTFSEDHILVKFKPKEELNKTRKSNSNVNNRKQLINKFNVENIKVYRCGVEKWNIKNGTIEETLKKLNENALIEYAEPDYKMTIDEIPNDPYYNDQWGLKDNFGIDAQEGWVQISGDTSVIIGILDTGIDYDHPDLKDNIWINKNEIPGNGIDDDNNGYIDDIHGWDFLNNDNDPMDDNGHGTHVAGIIGAKGNNEIGIAGVMWDCQMIPLKVLGPYGETYISTIIEAIEYANMMGVKITNNSYGGNLNSLAFQEAIQETENNNNIFIASAGNDCLDIDIHPHYPASYTNSNIVSVASCDIDGTISYFSNYGKASVDIVAPGNNILSTAIDNKYEYKFGTSMSAPFVTGIIALLYSTTDNINGTKNMLMNGGKINNNLSDKILTSSYANLFLSMNEDNSPDYKINVSCSEGYDVPINYQINFSGNNILTVPFDLEINSYQNLSLTAPSSFKGRNFGYWTVDGNIYSYEENINIRIDYNHNISVHYPSYKLSISNPDNILIEISPNDLHGRGNATDDVLREFSYGTEVTIKLPDFIDNKKFEYLYKILDTRDDIIIDDKEICFLKSESILNITDNYNLHYSYSKKFLWRKSLDDYIIDLNLEYFKPHFSSLSIDHSNNVVAKLAELISYSSNGNLIWNWKPVDGFYNKQMISQASPVILDESSIIIADDPDGGRNASIFILNNYKTNNIEYFKILSENNTITSKWIKTPAVGPQGDIYVVISFLDYQSGEYYSKLYSIQKNGIRNWTLTFNEEMTRPPTIGVNGFIYITSKIEDNKSGALYKVSPDGDIIWKYDDVKSDIRTSPVIATDGSLYFGTGFGDPKLYAIDSDGNYRWSFSLYSETCGYMTLAKSDPVIDNDGTIYIGDGGGNLFAINPNGTKKWDVALQVSRNNSMKFVYSSPVIADNGLIFVSTVEGEYEYNERGRVLAFNKSGELVWESLTPGSIWGGMTLSSDGTLYAHCGRSKFSNGFLYAFNTQSKGLENSAWPKYQNNIFNNGMANNKLTPPTINEINRNGKKVYINMSSEYENSEYRIQISCFENFYDYREFSDISTNDFEITDLNPIQHYFLRIGITCEMGRTLWGNTVLIDVDSPRSVTLKSPINNLNKVKDNIVLEWLKNNMAETYRLQVTKNENFSNTILDTSKLVDTSFVLNSLENLSTYYWRVNASNQGGTSDWSNIWNFKTIGKPNKLTQLFPVDNAVDQPINLKFVWTKAKDSLVLSKKNFASSMNNYWFELSTDTNSSAFLTDSMLVDTTKFVSKLSNDKQFFWRVRARNEFGWSVFTSWNNFKTVIDTPSTVNLKSPINNSNKIVNPVLVIWEKNNMAETYRLQVTKNENFSTAILDTSNLVDTSFVLNSLEDLSTYYWRVNASNQGGTSDWSETWRFTTIGIPDNPHLIYPLNNTNFPDSTDQINFIWSKVSDVENYFFELSKNESFDSLIAKDYSLLDTIFIYHKDIEINNFYWRVCADNIAGTSEWSEIFSGNFTSNNVYIDDQLKPRRFNLYQNYPNPFNITTNIKYSIPEKSFVSIKIFDSSGKIVKDLVNKNQQIGSYCVFWDAEGLPSGIYFYKISANKFINVKKCLLIK